MNSFKSQRVDGPAHRGKPLTGMTVCLALIALGGCASTVDDSRASCPSHQRSAAFEQASPEAPPGTSLLVDGVLLKHPGFRTLPLERVDGAGLLLSPAPGQGQLEIDLVEGAAERISLEVQGDHDVAVLLRAYENSDDRESLGELTLSGAGLHDISGGFGDVAIQRLTLQIESGEAIISRLLYTTPNYVTVDFAAGDGDDSQTLSVGGLQVTGSAALRRHSGLSVIGGRSDRLIDSGESVYFGFDGGAAYAVYLQRSLLGNTDGDDTVGDVLLEAFDFHGDSLGTRPFATGDATVPVSRLFGAAPISAFRVTSDGDYQVIAALRYATCGK
jgi:hypothetical protein